jgi:hypothetical protein
MWPRGGSDSKPLPVPGAAEHARGFRGLGGGRIVRARIEVLGNEALATLSSVRDLTPLPAARTATRLRASLKGQDRERPDTEPAVRGGSADAAALLVTGCGAGPGEWKGPCRVRSKSSGRVNGHFGRRGSVPATCSGPSE